MRRPLVVTICVGSSCHLRGAPDLIQRCSELIAERKLEQRVVLKGSFCISHCGEGMNFRVGRGRVQTAATVDDALRMITDQILPAAEEG